MTSAQDHSVPPTGMTGSQVRRIRRILAGAGTAFVGKGVNVLTSFLLVPLTLRYLGSERYGIWVILSSAITMYLVFDVGIANSLTNLISEAFAKQDKKHAAVSFTTALYTSIVIALVLGVLGFLLTGWVDWPQLFHVRSLSVANEAAVGTRVSLLMFLLLLPLSLCQRVLAGYQEVHVANGFAVAGSLLGLGAVVTAVHLHGTIPWLVACYAGANVFINVVCTLWLFTFHKPWMKPLPRYFDRALVRSILFSGLGFFVIQLSGLAVFSADNLLIGHYLSPADVTPYSVTWRLVSSIAILQTLAFPSLWPAYSEAYARGDDVWLRSTYRRVRAGTAMILAAGCGAVLLFGRNIIGIWAGPAAVPSMTLLALMCVWIAIYAITMNQSCLMGAAMRVKSQAAASLAAAVLNVFLSILWVKTLGSAGVLLGTIVSYLIFVVGIQTYEVHRILHERKPTHTASASPALPELVEP